MVRQFLLLALLVAFAPRSSFSAETPSQAAVGESVYNSAAESVFLLETLDQKGDLRATGSGFLIDKQKVITNYHVVQDGDVFLRAGAVRVKCSVTRFDEQNDLALIEVGQIITARPLQLSASDPSAGATVFAIGNPAGLERTISQGLVSGRRQVDGASLLQISAPISPGSSGGPVLNESGEVVGVAVGYLEGGQNLNFAVPVEAIHSLLKGDSSGEAGFKAVIAQLVVLREKLEGVDPSSVEWQNLQTQIDTRLSKALALAAGSTEHLTTLAEYAQENFKLQTAAAAAQEIIALSPSDLRARRILAEALHFLAIFDDGNRDALLGQAQGHANFVLSSAARPQSMDYFRLGSILELLPDKQSEAHINFKRALDTARTHGEDLPEMYYQALFRTSPDLKTARPWFKALVERKEASAANWARIGALESLESNHDNAAIAWETAAMLEPTAEYWTQAGRSYWIAGKTDEALRALRKVTEVGVGKEGAEMDLAFSYRAMSSIFFDRGVYDQSITFAKQAIALDPQDGWAYLSLSKSLNALERNSEAASAAENAIRLTDGKYGAMHFALGTAHFDLRDWSQSERAFRKAAELEPKDSAAAYNVALCLQRQGFYSDAAKWFEEVLRRSPNHPDRSEILKSIQKLRQ